MFLTRLWMLVLSFALLIAVLLIAVLPKPAHRERDHVAREKLALACEVSTIWLENSAHQRLGIATSFARQADLVSALDAASNAAQISEAINLATKTVGAAALGEIANNKPDFAILIDRNGRVVARVGKDETQFGDSMSGRPLIDDALGGFIRDDVWFDKTSLYLVAAAPVVATTSPQRYAGAILLGHAITRESLGPFAKSLGLEMAAFLGPQQVANTSKSRLDGIGLAPPAKQKGCPREAVRISRSGDQDIVALSFPLPGESEAQAAYMVLFGSRPYEDGLFSTLGKLGKPDFELPIVLLGMIGAIFLGALILGLLLPYLESGRPLRRLQKASVGLAQGESEKFEEKDHGGRYGDIARAVNIALDKLMRETKSARNDLDQLLTGATTSASTVGIAAMPAPLPPPVGNADDFSLESLNKRYANDDLDLPPPPTASSQMASFGAPTGNAGGKGKPPSLPLPPTPRAPTSGAGPAGGPAGGEDPQLRTIYDEYIRTKQSCGESTTGLTFTKFEETIARNRAQLISQTGCVDVKFSVYVKDGKAALRAVPIRS